jgi:hypothetical protein
MVKYRFTIGLTPEKVIEKQLPETYIMELTSDDYELFAKLVNIGIDSRLQAIFADKISTIKEYFTHKAKIELDKQSMVCFLNRLLDYSAFGEFANEDLLDDSEKMEAYDLRSCILETIGIEEI